MCDMRNDNTNTSLRNFQLNFSMFLVMLVAISIVAMAQVAESYHKHSQGHVKIKVWRGPSHGYKKHKHAPFGYHFSIEEKGH